MIRKTFERGTNDLNSNSYQIGYLIFTGTWGVNGIGSHCTKNCSEIKRTALHIAAKKGFTGIVSELLSNKQILSKIPTMYVPDKSVAKGKQRDLTYIDVNSQVTFDRP